MTGTNKLCQQCKNTCKQWYEVVIVRCPNFEFSGCQNLKEGTLTQGENAQEAPC